MRVFTIKAKPRTMLFLALALTCLVVITIAFVGNHNGAETVSATIDCSTAKKRVEYIRSAGLETDGNESVKEVTIPTEFNDVYEKYNEVQIKQGFDLSKYKGKKVSLYTYNIVGYEDKDSVIADLIVYDNQLIGADLCDTSADNGFLQGLK